MIDWKTILSSFDDKPTLLQWLKIVEKALQNASLEDVAIKNTGNNMYVFEFKFADGSTVTSSPINFLKEISGIEKVSDAIVGTQTVTTIRVNYIDDTSDDFSVAAENGKDGKSGKDGKAGKGVSSFEDINNAIAGTKTVTTIRAHFTDGTSDDFSVYAQNGSGGGSNIYMHKIAGILDDSAGSGFNINFLSSDSTEIKSVPEFFQFLQHNNCYLFTGDSYPLVYFNIKIFDNKIQIQGADIAKGTSIVGDVAQLVGDEVLTV